MRYYTSLHVHNGDRDAVRALASELIEPGLDAYLVESQGWTSLYSARLEEQTIADVDALAMPLTRLGPAVAFMVHDDAALAVAVGGDGARTALNADDPEAFGLEPEPLASNDELAAALETEPAITNVALTGGNASARVAGLAALLGVQMELACAGYDDLAELDEDGELPEEFEMIEGPDAGRPGLSEFFGHPEHEP
ncbi:MAG TPA: hypothetical protein VNT60_04990 [Deinococcales bacterium]|nr:hypothetical protein [Deinococcales bacterium]